MQPETPSDAAPDLLKALGITEERAREVFSRFFLMAQVHQSRAAIIQEAVMWIEQGQISQVEALWVLFKYGEAELRTGLLKFLITGKAQPI